MSPYTLAAEIYNSKHADMIFTNAKIYGHDNANAIAVRDGNIMFVGKAADVNAYRAKNTEVIDLEQAIVMPGFIDNHNHVYSLKMGETGLPDVYAAIDAYTINAADSLGISDITGSITVGKSADFAILEQDITRLSHDAIAKTQILMTVLQGNIVYDAEE